MSVVQYCDPERPWGYWLQSLRFHDGFWLRDPNSGTRFRTLHDALWQGRLNMCACVAYQEPLDLMLETLISVNIGFPRMIPDRLAVGDGLFFRHYMYWLNSVGLVWHFDHPLDRPRLSDEAKSIVLLLKQTHPLATEAGYHAAISAQDRTLFLGSDDDDDDDD